MFAITLRPFYPGKIPNTDWSSGCVCPEVRSGLSEDENIFCLEWNSNSVRPAHSLVALQTALPGPRCREFG